MHGHGSLTILERSEFLRTRAGDGGIARNDFLDQPTHRLDAQRQWNHIQQQPVITGRTITCEQVRLHGSAERDDFVGVNVRQWKRLEIIADRLSHMGHTRCAADQHDAIDITRGQIRIAHRLAASGDGLADQVLCHGSELCVGESQAHFFA